jgi:hypothetical protein
MSTRSNVNERRNDTGSFRVVLMSAVTTFSDCLSGTLTMTTNRDELYIRAADSASPKLFLWGHLLTLAKMSAAKKVIINNRLEV